MWNRVDAQLTPGEIQNMLNLIDQVINSMPQIATQTAKERKKGGFYHSRKAFEMAKKLLRSVKSKPAYFPLVNEVSFAKDIAYVEGLRLVESKISQIAVIVSDTQKVLLKDINEQATYAYRQMQIMHENGVPEGKTFPKLQEYMPKTGKKKKKVIE